MPTMKYLYLFENKAMGEIISINTIIPQINKIMSLFTIKFQNIESLSENQFPSILLLIKKAVFILSDENQHTYKETYFQFLVYFSCLIR